MNECKIREEEMCTMKRVVLDELNDFIFRNNSDLQCFMGYTVVANVDIHGNKYELKDGEEKYYLLTKIEGTSVFVSEARLLHTLLREYIKDIESGRIYDHGYPESRLIPANHSESCEESIRDYASSNVSEKVEAILGDYFRYI